jgi:hypothetical protein
MLQTVGFQREGDGVLIVVGGRRLCTLGVKASLEACRALDKQLRSALSRTMNPALLVVGETGVFWRGQGLSFREELDTIVCIGGNPERLLFDMNTVPTAGGGPSIARQVWSAWLGVTRQVEEWIERERVARDAAILHRSGAPMGIAHSPIIRAEAQKLATGDRDLRRFMPDKRRSVTSGGVLSDEVLGTPTIGHDTRSSAIRLTGILNSLPPHLRGEAFRKATEGKRT